jgi:hypothetical protein
MYNIQYKKSKNQIQKHLRGEVSPTLQRKAALPPFFSATPSAGAGRPRNAPPKVKTNVKINIKQLGIM